MKPFNKLGCRESFRHICRGWIFYLKEIFVHRGISSAWDKACRVDDMTRDEVIALQQRKMDNLLKYAVMHVPFYRRYASEHGMNVNALHISDFPVVRKPDIRGHEQDFVSDEYRVDELACGSTSGSTGEPFRFYHAKSEYTYSYAVLWRGLARFGLRPGDRRVMFRGISGNGGLTWSTRIRVILSRMFNRMLLVDAHFLARSDENIAVSYKRICAYHPVYFHGYVSAIYQLAAYLKRKGISADKLRRTLKVVVTESEKCRDFQRELIEEVLGVPVIENYGSVEFSMIAQPDVNGKKCINDDHIFIEEADGHEAVITNLDAYAFPFIRFCNGDQVILGGISGPYRTIDEIIGRSVEMLKLPTGGEIHGFTVLLPLLKHQSLFRNYQVQQKSLNHLIFRLIPMQEVPEDILDQIKREVKAVYGADVKIDFEFVDKIPLTSRGKQTFVYSDVNTVVN